MEAMESTNPPPSLTRIADRRVLAEEVYLAIRQAILRLEIEPGSQLVELDLAAKFGVSKSPVREALLRLAGEGLVTQTPYRGCVLSVLSDDEVDEIYTLREELEALAVRLATPRLTLAVISKARNLLAEAWRAIERDDRVQLAERNTEFHMIFCAHSGNGHLHRILSNLQDKVTLSSILGWRAHATMTIEHEQHTRILDAAEARDADLAAQRMRDHVHEFRVHYRKGENDIATAQR